MRCSLVFCLAVSFAMFGFGLSLQCYSCPEGSTANCEVKQECMGPEDSCLKLKSGETTYTQCISYADCDFRTLAVKFPVAKFTFSCCNSDLCNRKKKSFMDEIREFFG